MKVRKWIENGQKCRQSHPVQIRPQFQSGEPGTATATGHQAEELSFSPAPCTPPMALLPLCPGQGTLWMLLPTILKSPLSLLQGIIRIKLRVRRGQMRLALRRSPFRDLVCGETKGEAGQASISRQSRLRTVLPTRSHQVGMEGRCSQSQKGDQRWGGKIKIKQNRITPPPIICLAHEYLRLIPLTLQRKEIPSDSVET